MAIDTRQKRMSMIEFGGGHSWHTLPEADAGAIEADDREHLLGLYSGVALDDPAAGDGFIIIFARRRRRQGARR